MRDDDRLTGSLPVWMNRGDAVRLKNALFAFWQRVHGWISWPLTQTDPLTCSEPILNLRAWQYDIRRFNGEPLSLFRLRVKFAFINAQDSGSTVGFVRIFERLKIGRVVLHERNPGIDWDVILLTLTAQQVSEHIELLGIIIRQYGRTCRRYRYQVRLLIHVYMYSGFIHGGYMAFTASTYTKNTSFDLITRRDRALLITGHGSLQHVITAFPATLTGQNYDTDSYTFTV